MAPAEEQQKVIDGEPLLEAAGKLKEQGNAKTKEKKYSEAVALYEQGIAILDKADGHPMLRKEAEAVVALKVVLYNNAAQCLLNQELWRRALASAAAGLHLDPENTKALYRRAVAQEKLRKHKEALADFRALEKLGGGALTKEELQARIDGLKKKVEAEIRAKAEESSDDEVDNELVKMKERFDEIVEKYDLRDGEAAGEVADWLVSGEWLMTTKRVAQRWKMEEQDAEDFLKWIAKGLEFKIQNAQAQQQAEQTAPSLGD